MSSNLKVNSLVPATGTEIGIGTTGGSIDFRCPATFGGNVTIGGTLTYDEVINIDSIGIITARTGLNVSSGTATFAGAIDANGDLDVDGHTELDNVNVSGVVTFTNSPNAIQMNDNGRVSFGTSLKTSISYDSSASRTKIRNWNDTLEIGYRNTEIHHTNQVRLSFLNGQNTFSNNGSTVFTGDNYSALWIPSSDTFRFNDNAKLVLGTNSDTTIFHNNSNLLISNTNGNINVTGNVVLNNDISVDGHTELDNVNISGVVTATQFKSVNGSNTAYFKDNQLSFSPTGHAYIDHGTTAKDIYFRLSRASALDTTMMQFDSDGEIIKFHKMISVGLQGGGDTATLGGGSGVGAQLTLKYADGTFNTRLLGNNNSYLNVNHGNLGIGTAVAGKKLHVFKSNQHPVILERGDNANTQIELKSAAATRGYWGASDTSNFMVYDNDASHINFTVMQTGYVGINVTNPQAFLDIGGNTDGHVKASFTRANDPNFRIQFRNESSSNNVGESQGKFGLFYASNGADICGMQFLRGASTGAGSLTLTTGGAEKVRIGSSGQIGLSGANYGTARQVMVSNGSSSAVSWSSNPFLLDMDSLGDLDYDGVFLRYREVNVSGNGLVYLGLCKSTTNCPAGRIGCPVGFVPGVVYNSQFRVDKVGITPWPDTSGHRYEYFAIISDYVSAGKLGIFYLTNSTN